MSKPVSLKVEISNLAEMLRRQASEKPHIDYIAAPNTFLLSTHPITFRIRNGRLKKPFEKLLGIIYAREEIKTLHGEDVSAAFFHMGWSSSARAAAKKETEKKGGRKR
ncbi:MAG: hypothetical protein DRP11_03205 [Candidatus Aenigmatarchaeota archaeon]|nr:MAG: hypothetical protein DRP11_03205 [Candidatus Aenigmarchaeota archaeon]